jgi:hypothetical protein
MRGDSNLGGAVLFFSKAQPIADYLVRRPMVTSRWLRLLSPTFFLAANPANLGNTLEMAITLCRFGVRRFARHCRAAFRLVAAAGSKKTSMSTAKKAGHSA